MIGIVVGFAAEARLARGVGGTVAIGGGGASGAAEAANRLAQSGVTALLSFGLAGGLAPGLVAGALVIPDSVVTETGERWLADPALAARLGPAAGALLAADAVIATRADKRAAWQRTAALAADIESGAVARAASAHRLPFAVLRAVCDPANRDLPPAALTALDAKGRIRPGALLASLARQPGQIGALIALGREAALARAALLARVAAIGPLD
jgi:adenosylhomocysteine nucleosidase